ncbi:MAG: metallophosphoesterase family protein [Hyphomicrobiaceae bacterium]
MPDETNEDGSGNVIPALIPRGAGHQFVLYGDACSGVPGALHEQTFATVNAVVQRLGPRPEFIIFPGDEIIGLVEDRAGLLAQWRHWREHEMGWLDRDAIPMWHATGNHTTYDEMSEQVFREVLAMPRNGPAGQEGLSYWVRRGDLLLVFVHTLWSGLGGEGHVDIAWMDGVLAGNRDARHKFVVGHHPAFPVNGFAGPIQRDIEPETADAFWQSLVRHGVHAYLCSHILAFDVQAHEGVLQICTAGAGTAHRMPEGVEYLHCVQMAVDEEGLRYQVLDTDGAVREDLDWTFAALQNQQWAGLQAGTIAAPVAFPPEERMLDLRFAAVAAPAGMARRQTLLCAGRDGALPSLWIGLGGTRQRLMVIMHHAPGRSPYYWLGPDITPSEPFALDLRLDWRMGPGGLLVRETGSPRWTSMSAASAWGLERLQPCTTWHIGQGSRGPDDRPFAGTDLRVAMARERK